MVEYIGEVFNQAKRITVKPRTKLISIGSNIYEVGYHYKVKHGKRHKSQKDVVYY